MKQATAISVGLHALVLAWAMLSWNGQVFEVPPAQSLPVEFVSEKDFSQMTKGIKDAPKKEKPKPIVEKKAEPKPPEQPKAKVAKKEVKAALDKVPEPPPQPESKPAEKKEAKAKPEPKPKPQPKIDPIAEKLKQENAKQREAKAAPALPPRRPPRPHHKEPKFDADKIAALLDKREPTRTLATGDDLNNAPALGTSLGQAANLSQSELDALRARLMSLWNPPVGIKDPEDYIIRIRIRLSRDGRLSAPPQVITSGRGQLYDSARDSAVRAVFRGQPFNMLRPEHYAVWKDIEVTFDPRDMFRG